MQESLLKRFWKHRIYVSVAWSDTSVVRGFHLRSSWCFMLLMGAVGFSMYGLHGYQDRIEEQMAKRGEVPEYLKSEISRLKEEESLNNEQLRMFAQELGVIQARLDRFDAIGDKLFNDPSLATHLDISDNPELGGKGGVELPKLQTTPSIEELKNKLTLIQDRTVEVGSVMSAGMQLLLSQEIEKSQKPYLWPVMHPRSYTTSKFGYRKDPFKKTRRWHGGLDFGAPRGAPIISTGDGVVVFAGYRYNFGNTVEIRHAHGFVTRYAHMQETLVKNGQSVKAGDMIGKLGSTGRSTGPHLHLEVLLDDTKIDPYPMIKGTKKYVQNMAKQLAYKNQLNKKQIVN